MGVEDKLRTEHPYGDPRFIPLALEEIALHSRKNHDYAAGGTPLGNFERRAALASHYPKLDLSDPAQVALWDILKQLDAALWMVTNSTTPMVEGFEARMQDVAVYAKLAMLLFRATGRESHGEG